MKSRGAVQQNDLRLLRVNGSEVVLGCLARDFADGSR